MSNKEKNRTSGEIYLEICKCRRKFQGKVKVEDLKALLETIQLELLGTSQSPFLNACYSVWLNYVKRLKVQDGMYTPHAFRLSISSEPYALYSNDAFHVFKLLADDLSNENIGAALDKWAGKYAGGRFDYPNPAAYIIDTLIRRIDEGLIKTYQAMVQQQRALHEMIQNDPNANVVIEAAQLKAKQILALAEEQREKSEARTKQLEQEAARLRKEGELAASALYVQAEKAEQLRKQEGEQLLAQAQEDAKRLCENAKHQAEWIVAAAEKKGEAVVARAKARANEITQKAKEEQYLAQNAGLKDGIELVLRQFAQTQEEMRALEERFDQVQLMKVFNTFYSLYELIDLNKKSLQTLPKEYSYICDNMDIFQEVIQDGLADFGIKTFISESDTPFDGKLHEVQGDAVFDPAKALVKCSLRPGFMNTATENMLRREQVEIICE